MPPTQQLSPARSQSSDGRFTLGGDDDNSATSVASCIMHHRQERQQLAKKIRSPRCIVAVLAVLVFVTQFGASLSDVPSVRLLQEVVCRKHYGLAPDESVEEDKCRTDWVQGELNVISTGALIFGYLPGKYSLSPSYLLCGGGSAMANSDYARPPSRTSLRYARRPTRAQAGAGALHLRHDLVSTDMDRRCLESYTLGLAHRLALVSASTHRWRRNRCRGHGLCDRGRCRTRGENVGIVPHRECIGLLKDRR